MTREKAVQVERLLVKIEAYEALLDDISNMDTLQEIIVGYNEDTLKTELLDVVQIRLDKLLKELEEI